MPDLSYAATAPERAPFYCPSPTAEDFIHSLSNGPATEFRIVELMGSRGEGKTTAAIYGIGALAQRIMLEEQVRGAVQTDLPIRVAVVRDTWANLARTTLVSFKEAERKGLPVVWLEQDHEALIPGVAHFYFFGLDSRADADKLQGFMCGVLWLEEVAPAAELASGIPVEAFALGITSVRQERIPKRVILTFNPPDEDHWVLNVEETLSQAGSEDIIIRRFDIPAGEKARHFEVMAERAAQAGEFQQGVEWVEAAKEFEAYRRRNKLALEVAGRHDLVARLHEGKVGGVVLGEAIVGSFSYNHHVTSQPIVLQQSAQMVRCWDAGLTPSTVWLQVTAAGNIDILGSRTSVNKGMAEHILEEVLPFQAQYNLRTPKEATGERGWGRGAQQGWKFRDIGDPNVFKGDEAKRAEDSAGRTINQMLNTSFERGPSAWPTRREALNIAFRRGGNGDRARLILIYKPENKMLIQGLNGRAHYKSNPATGVIDPSIEAAKKVSGIYFQALDALGHALGRLFPADEWLKRAQQQMPPRVRNPRRTWLSA